MPHDRIILSAKVSGVRDLVDVYRLLAARSDYPLHLGLTEAGMGDKGVIASTAGLAILLNEGIGDTIRVSLTPEPGAPREREVEIAPAGPPVDGPSLVPAARCRPARAAAGRPRPSSRRWLSRSRAISRSRCRSGVRPTRAPRTCAWRSWAAWSTGPGESKHADIGISLPGTFEEPVAPVFIDGRLDRTLRGDGLVDEFIGILEAYVAERFPTPAV